jgi:hypothetical protein
MSEAFTELLIPLDPMNQTVAMMRALMIHQATCQWNWSFRNWLPKPPKAEKSIAPTHP